ncbi:MAG TPA: 50S ribosomal protein L22 [Phycisphaerales bacterium]|jgi:large subunit ribosomal protein L22|nr:50S ribosomal protein L22 [Phycisphaerales bacterium]
MAYTATHRFARIAPRKAQLVADLIRGRKVEEALTQLQMSKKRAAYYFRTVLKSAVANAEEADADIRNLVVTESRVDQGPTMKRFNQKDRGRAHPILKRSSHLVVAVDEKD